ncbi:helix-turn-helix domain-containing protein [Sunxiuqinia rutila]|uniref:helix-turn-helix domain-containing protein n=1 Tax=Sunxiuqinia rutila TaxID=1397841 RepID=UPI003D36A1DF
MDKREISIAELLQRIEERQQSIENLILSQKDVLTFEEAATYMGISKSHLYKMTMLGSLEFYKPRGKMIYFELESINRFLLQNRISPADEIQARASTYVSLNNRRAAK